MTPRTRAGWDLGVAGMQVGGERKLKIPAKLAYGSQKIAGIPANSTLLFDVKVRPALFSVARGCPADSVVPPVLAARLAQVDAPLPRPATLSPPEKHRAVAIILARH